jgi:transcription antitermination protein NusB
MRRRIAREIALQCLYQMELNPINVDNALQIVLEEARKENETQLEMPEEPWELQYIHAILNGIASNRIDLDQRLDAIMEEWTIERLSRVDKHVLRMAAYEMLHEQGVPRKAAMNEAIELAKRYGTEQSGKFVNGILGKLFQQLEGTEA